jgi:uncharacterized protein (UPF0332 family)
VSSFTWAEFLRVAEALASEAQKDGSEGKRRSALSRAYYATFNAAREYASQKWNFTVKPGEGSAHGKLWNELSFKPGKDAKLASQGKQLLKMRKEADYDKSPPVVDAQVTNGLCIARNAAQLLAELQSPPPPPPAGS